MTPLDSTMRTAGLAHVRSKVGWPRPSGMAKQFLTPAGPKSSCLDHISSGLLRRLARPTTRGQRTMLETEHIQPWYIHSGAPILFGECGESGIECSEDVFQQPLITVRVRVYQLGPVFEARLVGVEVSYSFNESCCRCHQFIERGNTT